MEFEMEDNRNTREQIHIDHVHSFIHVSSNLPNMNTNLWKPKQETMRCKTVQNM